MLTLFYYYPACSIVSHIALEESGLQYESKLSRPHVPEELAALLQINPKGTVPAAVIDDVAITENIAILSFIDREAPGAKLFPTESVARARTESFLAWAASTVHINFRQSGWPLWFTDDASAHAGLRSKGLEKFWGHLQAMDRMLARNPWVMGDQFTVADCYALLFYGWGKMSKLPVGELNSYTAHQDRMILRPAVQTVLARERASLQASAAAG